MRKDQLKRRLVGALVLVSLAIIFVPMMLDSRAVEENLGAAIPSRNAGPFDENLAQQSPLPIERSDFKPAPAPFDPSQKPSAAAGVPQASSPEVDNLVPPPPLVAWVVQVGSFSQQDNAESVASRLRAAGFDTVIEKAMVDGQAVYRVQAGPESTEARAEQLRLQISDKVKLDGSVRQHPPA